MADAIAGPQEVLLLLGRLLVGAVFVVAGISKLRDLKGFVRVVAGYSLLPQAVSGKFAYVLPLAETAVGVGLLAGALTLYAAAFAFLLLLLFTAATLVNVARGRSLNCGCFGRTGRETAWHVLCRDVGLLLLATVSIIHPSGPIEAGSVFAEDTSVTFALTMSGFVGLALSQVRQWTRTFERETDRAVGSPLQTAVEPVSRSTGGMERRGFIKATLGVMAGSLLALKLGSAYDALAAIPGCGVCGCPSCTDCYGCVVYRWVDCRNCSPYGVCLDQYWEIWRARYCTDRCGAWCSICWLYGTRCSAGTCCG